MPKHTLTVTTPSATFSRTTNTAYTHAVVWHSPRAAAWHAAAAGGTNQSSGVGSRWVKDHGYGVTWHTSEATALRAVKAGYSWDNHATLFGVFAVDA